MWWLQQPFPAQTCRFTILAIRGVPPQTLLADINIVIGFLPSNNPHPRCKDFVPAVVGME